MVILTMKKYLPVFLIILGLVFIVSCREKITDIPAIQNEAWVREVIDGDTIELAGGERLRYIGIDTPEVRREKQGQWIYDPQPFAEEARDFNRRLVEGKKVRLEYDIEKRDKYGRLLAYVYVNDIFVNREMLRQGYAVLYTFPLNVKYVDLFVAAEEEAMHNQRGLWADYTAE